MNPNQQQKNQQINSKNINTQLNNLKYTNQKSSNDEFLLDDISISPELQIIQQKMEIEENNSKVKIIDSKIPQSDSQIKHQSIQQPNLISNFQMTFSLNDQFNLSSSNPTWQQTQLNYRSSMNQFASDFDFIKNLEKDSFKEEKQKEQNLSIKNKQKFFENQNDLTKRSSISRLSTKFGYGQKDQQKNRLSFVLQDKQKTNNNFHKIINQEAIKPFQSKNEQSSFNKLQLSSHKKKANSRITMDMSSLIRMFESENASKVSQQTSEQKRERQFIEKLEQNLGQQLQQHKKSPNNFFHPNLAMDLKSLAQLYSQQTFEDEPSQQKQQKEQLTRRSEYLVGNTISNEDVILEDEREDDATPFKPTKIIESKESASKHSKSKSNLKVLQMQNYDTRISEIIPKKISASEDYLTKLEDFIETQKRIYQELAAAERGWGKVVDDLISHIKPSFQEVDRIKRQEEQIVRETQAKRKEINFNEYMNLKRLIKEIECRFGLNLHYYRSDNLDTTKDSRQEGFLMEFSLQDFLFKIKRNQGEELIKTKLLDGFPMKWKTMELTFDKETKRNLIEKFIRTKIRGYDLPIQVLSKIANYCEYLLQVEMTLEHLSQNFNMDNFELSGDGEKFSFQFIISEKYFSYLFTINLLNILEFNGGIQVYSISQKTFIKIPDSVYNLSQSLSKRTSQNDSKILKRNTELIESNSKLFKSFRYVLDNVFKGMEIFLKSKTTKAEQRMF